MTTMDDKKNPQDDPAVAEELKGVPEDLLDGWRRTRRHLRSAVAGEMDRLREELEAAKQDLLYAKADTQNVRRRLEKDVADARAYGATGFARDILSVADNLARALDAIPDAMREDEATQGPCRWGWKRRGARSTRCSPSTASAVSPRLACRSIPTSIRR